MVAFGRLIEVPVLAALPMVNLHFSLLPRWRGAAPVERAILAGDERTGVDLMAVEEGLDTGGIYGRAEVAIGPDETLAELRARLVRGGHPTPGRRPRRRAAGPRTPKRASPPTPPSSPPRISARLGGSRPSGPPSVRLGDAWTTHRGQAPEGVAHPRPTGRRRSRRWRRPTAPVELVEVQPEGKPRMAAGAWANGARWQPGDRLGS